MDPNFKLSKDKYKKYSDNPEYKRCKKNFTKYREMIVNSY